MSGRGWKVLIVGSVLLNIFLLGAIAGGAWRWLATQGVHQVPTAQRTALRFAADDLSPERQAQFIDALKAARREGRAYAREGRDDRRVVLDLLAAPQLDRAALDDALARTRTADVALRTQVESGIADFAATLTPAERVKFAEGLRQRGNWRLPAAKPPKAASETQ
jgi:uncharacterized membrane protein